MEPYNLYSEDIGVDIGLSKALNVIMKDSYTITIRMWYNIQLLFNN